MIKWAVERNEERKEMKKKNETNYRLLWTVATFIQFDWAAD